MWKIVAFSYIIFFNSFIYYPETEQIFASQIEWIPSEAMISILFMAYETVRNSDWSVEKFLL